MTEFDPQRIELLERQIAERVEERVRKRLFACYAVAGTAVIATLGITGFSIGKTVQDAAMQNISAKLKDAEVKLGRVDILSEQVAETVARVKIVTDTIAPTLSQLRENFSMADEQIKTIGDKRKEFEGILAALQTRAGQLEALNKDLTKQMSEISFKLSNLADPKATSTEKEEIVRSARTIAESARTAASTPLPTPQATLFVQFDNIDPDTAIKISGLIRAQNYTVPSPEKVTIKSANMREIRYFYAADMAAADNLARAAETASEAAGLPPAKTTIRDLTTWPHSKPAIGTLELWISGAPE